MKKTFILLITISTLVFPVYIFCQTGSVGIGTTTPHSSAALDVQSTDKGMLVPRMTTAQRTAISNAATGLLVFDNTTGTFWFYNGTVWTELVGGGGSGQWTQSGNNIYNSNTGNVGIGISNPPYPLSLKGGIGLYNAEGVYGYIQNTDVSHTNLYGNLNINAKPGNLISQTNSHDIILQYATGPGVTSGRVGVGTNNPIQKLDVSGSINLSNEINRTNTGTANLLPYCYGVIAANGTILSGSGNFTVLWGSTGRYMINVEGLASYNTPTVLFSNQSTYQSFWTYNPKFTNDIIEVFSWQLDFTNEIVFQGVTIPAIFRGGKAFRW